MSPEVTGFYDEATSTVTYVVADKVQKAAAVIDCVLDYAPCAGRTSTVSIDKITTFIKEQGLTLEWILETHPHADHLSGAIVLKERLGGRIGIGAQITAVQETWRGIYNLDPQFSADGSQFDHLFHDGDTFAIGALEAQVWQTPGHTPACVTYLAGDAAFIGDTLFMPDFGTARTDFPGGDARQLYGSIRRILSLPPETRIFVCHDYQPGGREVAWQTTVAEQRTNNKHVHDGVSEADYVTLRSARDAELDAPALLLPAIQVNIRGGHLPPAEDNGVSYLKIPLNKI